MLTILEHFLIACKPSDCQLLYGLKQRVCIIAGLEAAYCEETHDYVERFLQFLKGYFITYESGKVLLLCKAPFNVNDILGWDVEGASSIVNYGEPDESSSDSEVSEPKSIAVPETARTRLRGLEVLCLGWTLWGGQEIG